MIDRIVLDVHLGDPELLCQAGGADERREAGFRRGVDLGVTIEQHAHDFGMALGGSPH